MGGETHCLCQQCNAPAPATGACSARRGARGWCGRGRTGGRGWQRMPGWRHTLSQSPTPAGGCQRHPRLVRCEMRSLGVARGAGRVVWCCGWAQASESTVVVVPTPHTHTHTHTHIPISCMSDCRPRSGRSPAPASVPPHGSLVAGCGEQNRAPRNNTPTTDKETQGDQLTSGPSL